MIFFTFGYRNDNTTPDVIYVNVCIILYCFMIMILYMLKINTIRVTLKIFDIAYRLIVNLKLK